MEGGSRQFALALLSKYNKGNYSAAIAPQSEGVPIWYLLTACGEVCGLVLLDFMSPSITVLTGMLALDVSQRTKSTRLEQRRKRAAGGGADSELQTDMQRHVGKAPVTVRRLYALVK